MQWLIIGISGITCGGKTTLAHNLREYFQNQQNRQLLETNFKVGEIQMISQDDYFLPVNDKRHQIVRRINAINFELLTSLDMERMLTDIAWTLKGLNINKDNNSMHKTFDQHSKQQQQQQQLQLQGTQFHLIKNKQKFMASKQKQKHQQQCNQQQQQQQQQLQLRQEKELQKRYLLQQIQQNMLCNYIKNHLFTWTNSTQNLDNVVNILIIEGFTIFNHEMILNLCNIKFHFHLPYEKCYERRLKRIYDPPDVVGYFELCVWPHYEQSLNEYRHCKDIIYLNGEIERERIFKFVMKKFDEFFNVILTDNNSFYWNMVERGTKKLRSINTHIQHNNNNNNLNNNYHNVPANVTILDRMQH